MAGFFFKMEISIKYSIDVKMSIDLCVMNVLSIYFQISNPVAFYLYSGLTSCSQKLGKMIDGLCDGRTLV